MKIAYKHIKNFFLDSPSIEEISNKLFQLGHEHEINNEIFDMEFTPNRGDCLSLIGILRDLNVFYKTNLELDLYKKDITSLDLDFTNNAKKSCPSISFLNIVIKNPVTNYKNYLNDYFSDLKLNKNNFFTDVSNYIAYEMGQPTHCYDFDTIDGGIELKHNKHQIKFKTLLNTEIIISEKDLLFKDQAGEINLAGIVGGDRTACSNNTSNVLIECAYFRPADIMGKSTKYNLHSDASHKFERGVDPKCHEEVLRRFIYIVQDHVEIDKIEIFYDNKYKTDNLNLKFDLDKVNNILGTNITNDQYKDCLNKLGFLNHNDEIIVPSYRHDIFHQNDLAEEVARVIGYNNIPSQSINLTKKPSSISSNYLNKLKTYLSNQGFSEVVNFPFTGKNKTKNSIQIDNPLDSNRQFLRSELTSSLVDNIIFNEKRQKDSLKLFEISDVYIKNNSKIQKETRLALVVSGRQGLNYKDFSKILKQQYLISIFKNIDIDISNKIKTIDRNILNSKIKTPIFSLELPIADIKSKLSVLNNNFSFADTSIKYIEVSEYPSSFRDFSFSLSDSSVLNQVLTIINSSKAEYLKDFFMFDLYENKKSNEIKIGYRFIFQSDQKTLTDIEINNVVQKLLKPILEIDSVSIPGI